MEHKIKELAKAIAHEHTKKLVKRHVKGLHFENNHLTVFVENTAPLHEFQDKENEEHLKKAFEQIYGIDITYEFKLEKSHVFHEREKEVQHDINR